MTGRMTSHRVRRMQVVSMCSAVGIVLFSLFDRDFIAALGWAIVLLYQAERVGR